MRPGVVYGCLVPHPPVLIPAVGGSRAEKVRRTREAMQKVCRELSHLRPDGLVLISPHAPLHPHCVSVIASDYEGGFDEFGVDSIHLSRRLDSDLLDALRQECRADGVWLPSAGLLVGSHILDHGAAVPLYFLHEAGLACDILLLAPSFQGTSEHYRFGQLIARAAKRSGKRVGVVASGDMSHRLSPAAPAGYDARGMQFDELVVAALNRCDRSALLQLDEQLIDAAGECGYRPLVIALGAMEAAESDVISYEGPFGVGYLVARIRPKGRSAGDRSLLTGDELEAIRLARSAVEGYVREGRRPTLPSESEGLLARKAGVFVCLKVDGELRGCVGTYQAAESCVAAEIGRNAICAAVGDPRFDRVCIDELPRLRYSIDILSEPEPVDDISQLDPRRYGLLIRAGERRALLLPDLPGVQTAQEQIEIALRKGEIPVGTPIELSRFTVHRIEEP